MMTATCLPMLEPVMRAQFLAPSSFIVISTIGELYTGSMVDFAFVMTPPVSSAFFFTGMRV